MCFFFFSFFLFVTMKFLHFTTTSINKNSPFYHSSSRDMVINERVTFDATSIKIYTFHVPVAQTNHVAFYYTHYTPSISTIIFPFFDAFQPERVTATLSHDFIPHAPWFYDSAAQLSSPSPLLVVFSTYFLSSRSLLSLFPFTSFSITRVISCYSRSILLFRIFLITLKYTFTEKKNIK